MDSDEETEEFQAWKGVPGTVVLINVYNPMNTATPAISHVATCRMIRQHLRLASNHYIGVCLYGTGDSEAASFGLQNVTEMFPLNLPNMDDYKKLQNINISSYGQAKDLKLSDALWHCSKMFTNCKKLLVSRTILILTRLDTPPIETDHRATYMRVSDLVESNIEVKIINVANEDVQVDKFYKNFLSEANSGKEVAVPRPIWDSKEIEHLMFQQSHRHLAIARLSFEIGNGLAIGVGVYKLLKSYNLLKNVNLHRDTNAILTSATNTVKVSNQENSNGMQMEVDGVENEQKPLPVLKSELLHYQNYGGERIEVTDKEKKKLNNPFGPPMLKLLGFKPAGIISKEKWFLKSGYFLYSNEGIIEGSTVAFKALHQACLEMRVVAICVLSTRVNAKPNIVALSPCSHPLGLDVEIGFDVIIIPFIESVRQVPIEDEDDNTVVPEAHKKTMKEIVNTLKFDYKPEMFENPKLQAQYRAIETIALADEDIEPFVDTTKQNIEKFQGLEEDLFEELFGPFGAVASKRLGPKESSSNSSKRPKFDGEIDEDLLQYRVSNKKVNMYTVEQLKQVLKWKNIQNLPALTGLKKNDLVNLVYEHCC